MSSWGLKYYPLSGFDCGQVLNKRHVRKHGFGKADNHGAGILLARGIFGAGGFFLAWVAGACLYSRCVY